MALFKNDSSMLKRQQDGLLSELHEIERSVYIAADADLSVFDRDEANDYGKVWGGASAGDIVGAPKVCARIARVVGCRALILLQLCAVVQMGHSCQAGHLCNDRHNKASARFPS